MTYARTSPGPMETLCMTLTAQVLKRIRTGSLTLSLPDRRIRRFGREGEAPAARMDVRDFRMFTRLVLDGDIGLGESHTAGEWTTPDLVTLMRLFLRNRDTLADGNWVTSFLTRIRERLDHIRLRNTVDNSRENIAAHYDLGNDFYRLFLDRRMVYSCAIFDAPGMSLEDAQEAKMAAVIQQAGIGPGDHVLEIGCGWGGFALFAARRTGCRVTGITVSRSQYETASRRVREAGLEKQVTIRLQDYRHAAGTYDKLVSVEMIEAVGPQFLNGFFRQCRRLLRPGGVMVLQSITIPDHQYDQYRRERDWIQKHIFPGGHLPSRAVITAAVERETDFRLQAVDEIGPHYATTLARWRDRFLANQDRLESMGFDDNFIRKWTYYLSVCEAGFSERALGDVQITLARP